MAREANDDSERLAGQVACRRRSASSDQLAAAPQRRRGGLHEKRQLTESLRAKQEGGGLVERGVVTVADQREASRLGGVAQ